MKETIKEASLQVTEENILITQTIEETLKEASFQVTEENNLKIYHMDQKVGSEQV